MSELLNISDDDSLEKQLSDAISNFRNELTKAQQSIVSASKIYVSAIDTIPEAKEEFTHAFPAISPKSWVRYEMIGRGQIIPEIASNPSIASMCAEKLPVSDQQKLVSGPIDVLCSDGLSVRVKYSDMTPDQIKIAFAKDHIRTLSEQRALIESEKLRKSAIEPLKSEHKTYTVKKNELVVFTPCTFKKQELLRIIKGME